MTDVTLWTVNGKYTLFHKTFQVDQGATTTAIHNMLLGLEFSHSPDTSPLSIVATFLSATPLLTDVPFVDHTLIL